MGKTCLKCGYERTSSDDAPDYACPKCGAVYAKVEAHLRRQAEKDGPAKQSKKLRVETPSLNSTRPAKRNGEGNLRIGQNRRRVARPVFTYLSPTRGVLTLGILALSTLLIFPFLLKPSYLAGNHSNAQQVVKQSSALPSSLEPQMSRQEPFVQNSLSYPPRSSYASLQDQSSNSFRRSDPMPVLRSDYGSPAGFIDAAGILHDERGMPSARFLHDGTILDRRGMPIGRLNSNGVVLDSLGMPAGTIKADGTVLDMTGVPVGHLR